MRQRSGRQTGILFTASLVASAFVLMGASCSGSSEEHATGEGTGSGAEGSTAPRIESIACSTGPPGTT